MQQSQPGRRRILRRVLWILGALVAVFALLFGRPAIHLTLAAWRDRDELQPPPTGFVDDASRLNLTAISESIEVAADPAEAERQLIALVNRARAEHMHIAIAGARHTMGGHTISPGGIALNMQSFDHFELDDTGEILHAQSGARWDQIIPYLDQRGRSIAIMQSNNSFSVGGSISANCHGWQPNRPPIASTVLGFRLLKADGEIVRCSRNENAELFSLAIGGYGLFGVILDVDLHVTANERYAEERFAIDADQMVDAFRQRVINRADVGLAYGRLCVAPDRFLRDGVLNVFVRAPCEAQDIPRLSTTPMAGLKRTIFRASAGSDYGKELRWDAEKVLSDHLTAKYFSRNQLLNDSVTLFQSRSANNTDILHEYFVPPDKFNSFVNQMRRIIPKHHGDLLNVTVRQVLRDDDCFLRYADQDMFALVLLFNQQRTADADATMQAITQELIDAALALGGRYYLPYRLHATLQQFAQAYPQAAQFFELKRRYDPDEIFQNEFYVKYGR